MLKLLSHVGVKLGDILVHNLTSTETEVKLQESIRGKEVYIIQSGSKKVNNDVFEMLTMVYACKTSSARKIVGLSPSDTSYRISKPMIYVIPEK